MIIIYGGMFILWGLVLKDILESDKTNDIKLIAVIAILIFFIPTAIAKAILIIYQYFNKNRSLK